MGSGVCCKNVSGACLNNEILSDTKGRNNDYQSFSYIECNETKIYPKENIKTNEITQSYNFQRNIYANTTNDLIDKTNTLFSQQPLFTSVKLIYPTNETNLIENKTKDNQYSFQDIIEMKSNTENNINIDNMDNTQTNRKKIDNLLQKLSQYGIPPSDDDFLYDGWKEFYPQNDNFFNWDAGKINPNKIIVKNENTQDLSKLEIYSGEVNNSFLEHGIGTLTTSKYIRKGCWRNGNFTGWGRESRRNGVVLEGKFIEGRVNGKGILKNNNKGFIYTGDFVNNMKEGQGTLVTSKLTYEGEFKNNMMNGYGKIKFLPEGHTYQGQFKNNNIEGEGEFRWVNGDVYKGNMENGKMNGFGIYTYSDGDFYEGNYVNGVKEGEGKLVSYSEKEIYEGEFKNGKPHGKGVLIKDGQTKNVEFYEGKILRTL